MTVRGYISLMIFGTAACWLAFWLVVSQLDPNQASWMVFGFFYLSLFFSLVGTFALIGTGFRLYILRHEIVVRQVMIAFRQALSFALLIVAALFLQSQGLFIWWNIVLLVVALTFIEFAVLLRQRRLPL